MRFEKWHGLGNDFVMLDDRDDQLELGPGLVRALCDRRFGIGADGVIRVAPGTNGGDLRMDYVNSDGSVGEMCGNGIRCLALFAREHGLIQESELKVSTLAGLKVLSILGDGRVRVDMGAPIFDPGRVPVIWTGGDALRARVEVAGKSLEVACLSMGNPHAVIFTHDPDALFDLGPEIERHEMFPAKTNVEFVTIESPDRLRARVWERGAGATMACGSGACAVAVAARLLQGAEPRVVVVLPGGDLEIEWEGSLDTDAPVLMTGPAQKSFEGEVDLGAYA
ncbi:MAG: diaminopimelate epimerase [Actinomycetota bacterium]